jgi:hypothetical protein
MKVKREIETNALVSRSRDQPLTPEKEALHDAIKAKATELEALFEELPAGRYKALALTGLDSFLGDVDHQGTDGLTKPGAPLISAAMCPRPRQTVYCLESEYP